MMQKYQDMGMFITRMARLWAHAPVMSSNLTPVC